MRHSLALNSSENVELSIRPEIGTENWKLINGQIDTKEVDCHIKFDGADKFSGIINPCKKTMDAEYIRW